ncbi:prolyl oligopeptidase family serine peptidase [Myxococcus llanfairpwllgwyngyllgogerychwyrndrobwllllantysiliogogogochensis]|uniref:Prolyl oligopeptidase family serine peptidase n=1 Tax=Myxococcus llanfairpwllgwyngyllgogerychwyrndrobwllllantysiliogogogochensis TaxID=2590453 RepID=A0A540WMS7_9BACT|nr:DPP IV N-terminal domain-containing protein [Myxococcus llanfairpwllgwyngyllgogerychwyrndrobwllllantysiliogogogochensis]TQF10316.1 prolyl oligopeptidase family serine peptidase [Myxococcus llanfairpwllgwyngyllgogerychwyrndrobwllllantysiliogogogochensis]
MRFPCVPLGLLLTALTGAPVLALDGESPSADASGPTPDATVQAKLDVANQFNRRVELLRDSLVPPRWLRDQDRLVFWSREGKDGGTWVLAHAKTGELKPLLSGEQLREQLSALLGKPVTAPRFFDVALAPDEQGIVFRLEGKTFGLGLTGGRVTLLSPEDRAALTLSPDHFLAPRGGALAVQRKGGFAVLGADGATVVERAGEERLDWRIPERPWSPDGRFLVVWRDDLRAVHQVPVVDYSDALEKVTTVPYAKTGTPLPRSELHVVEVATGRVTRIPPVEGETYDFFAGWNPEGTEALCLHLARDAKRLDLTAVTPGTGQRRHVLREERPETFVAGLDFAVGGWAKQVTALPGGRGYLWMSERDGWRHVYAYDRAGKLLRQLTRGAFPVHEVVGVAPQGDALYVLASADSGAPYEQLFYRGSLKGGALKRLSSGSGMHRITLSPSGQHYVDAWSSRAQPRLRELVSMEGGKRVRLTTADASEIEALGDVRPEPFIVKAADGVTPLHGVLYKPRDFDPAKRYPVLAYIYGGPFFNLLPWSYIGNSMSLTASGLAQLGFVTVLVDPRGGPGRSKAFQDANYGRVGQTEIPDYVTGLKQAASTRPWMDLERVGLYGHSWGGYFALRGMLTAPDFFKAGYAAAPGALTEEAIINEPYLNLPSANPQGYAVGDNLPLAGKLKGHLRLMHGTSDVNATLSVTMRMADALIRAGKHFELLIMPGEPHSPQGAAGRYYQDDVGLFFLRTLGAPR